MNLHFSNYVLFKKRAFRHLKLICLQEQMTKLTVHYVITVTVVQGGKKKKKHLRMKNKFQAPH